MAKDAEHLAKHYAKALLDVITEMRGKEVSTVRMQEQLVELSNVIQGEASAFFANPIFGREEKVRVLEAIFKKVKVEPEIDRFVRILASLNQMDLVDEVAREFSKVDRERRNEIEAVVRTAFPLSSKELARIGEALGRALKKKVLIDTQVDRELIGGVIAEVGGVVYDASIRSFLTRMQEEL
ncbi:MAG TPA: ATP synthase F1 subunit delta [Bdellovibrionota bacterium]|nr:ATP synthase F1 subunit delta [Bdellovibrionota bacterium]